MATPAPAAPVSRRIRAINAATQITTIAAGGNANTPINNNVTPPNLGDRPPYYLTQMRNANPYADCHFSFSDKCDNFMTNLLWNMNSILAVQAYNAFGEPGRAEADGVPKNQKRWCVPGRLWDGTRINIAPRNRTMLINMDLEGWYTLARFYRFDWRVERYPIEHCRASWVAWCGCRALTWDEAEYTGTVPGFASTVQTNQNNTSNASSTDSSTDTSSESGDD